MTIARGAAALLTALALTATAACTGDVKGSDVESKVEQTAKQQGVTAENVTCPDLAAKKGEKATCTLEIQKMKYKLVVEVRAVDGKKVNYFINAPTSAK